MSLDYFSILICVFGAALALTYMLTPLAAWLAPRIGMMDHPGVRHTHARPTPRLGGPAVFLGFHAGCAVCLLLCGPGFSGNLDRIWWMRFAVVSTAMLLVGLADDARGLRPSVKLAGQVAVAVLAYALGIRFGKMLNVPLPSVVDLVLTVGWFVAIVNAFNLIDGMDGLAAGLALIASLGLIVSLLLRKELDDMVMVFALTGACLAFLRFNFHPARIFLGDGGSMFLGLTIAAVSCSTASKTALVPSLLVPLLAVGVPVFDTLLAVWRRGVRRHLRRGAADGAAAPAIMAADHEHLHHRLGRGGLSPRRVATILYLLSGALVVTGLLMMTFKSRVVGISLTAFVGGVYVVVRHLAHVEMWDTGNAILRGLQRPPRKTIAVILYPLVDMALMGGTLAVTMRLLSDTPAGPAPDLILRDSVVWVGVPFLMLVLTGTYRRVWTRAGAAEFAVLLFSLSGGMLFAAGLANILFGHSGRELATRIAVYGGLTLAALTGLRAIRPVALALVAGRRPRAGAAAPPRRLLLYGAGDRAMLFLREQDYALPDDRGRESVAGLLDPDTNLYGRLIHGHPVLGGMDYLLQESESVAFDELVLVADLSPEDHARLRDIARRRNLEVSEWRTERRHFHAGGEGSDFGVQRGQESRVQAGMDS